MFGVIGRMQRFLKVSRICLLGSFKYGIIRLINLRQGASIDHNKSFAGSSTTGDFKDRHASTSSTRYFQGAYTMNGSSEC